LTLVPQQTGQLVASPRDASGNGLTGRAVSWNTTSAGTATVDVNGLVTAVTAGSANITATSEGQVGTASVTVQEGGFVNPAGGTITTAAGNVVIQLPAQALAVATAITVTPVTNPQADPGLVSGTAYDFGPTGTSFAQPVTLKIKYAAASVLVGAQPAQFRVHRLVGTTWTPLAGSTVDVLTRTVTGQTTSFSIYAVLEVPAPVATVTITPGSASLLVGATQPLTATLRDAANNILTGRNVTWSPSSGAVASVSAGGVVTAIAPGGPVTITATSEGQIGSAQITVIAPVATVTISPPAASLVVGTTTPLTVTLRDAANNILTGRTVIWSPSSGAIASVSASGLVTAIAPGGPVTVTATSEGRTGSAQITVLARVTSVVLTGALRVKVGDDYTYTATARLGDGTVVVRPITWGVLETSKGTITTGGVLRASQTGVINILATIDGVVWQGFTTAYDWDFLTGSGSLFLSLLADNQITNKFGTSEYPELVIACSASGSFVIWVDTDNFVTQNGLVSYNFDGGQISSQTWIEFDLFSALAHPGTNLAQKSFALTMALSRTFGFAFTEFQASAKAMIFRVTGLDTRIGQLITACPSNSLMALSTGEMSIAEILSATMIHPSPMTAERQLRTQVGPQASVAPKLVPTPPRIDSQAAVRRP
jgi:uncharacterized protein YjdB